jgi:hypothetical protein
LKEFNIGLHNIFFIPLVTTEIIKQHKAVSLLPNHLSLKTLHKTGKNPTCHPGILIEVIVEPQSLCCCILEASRLL